MKSPIAIASPTATVTALISEPDMVFVPSLLANTLALGWLVPVLLPPLPVAVELPPLLVVEDEFASRNSFPGRVARMISRALMSCPRP